MLFRSVDDPTTPITTIANAPGILWLSVHPEFPSIYCTDISATNDGDPLHYKVEFTYDLVKPEDRHLLPWERDPKFSFSGGVTTGPAIVHYNNGFSNPKFIVNSAGDPLEGAQKEQAEWRIQIQLNVQTFDYGKAMNYVNAVNSDSWSGAAPGTLKCQSISGQREIEQIDQGGSKVDVPYWSVTADLAYRVEGWDLKLWDVGFNEIVSGGRRKILDKLNEPVSDPVALSGGVAKSPGQPPDMLTFKVYKSAAFTGTFPPLPS